MKIKILKRAENELKFEIEGEGHTLCNLLEKTILEDEDIDMAAYNIPHPLTSNPIMYIRTKGGRKPEDAIKEAIKKIIDIDEEFMLEFNKALKRWSEESSN